MRNEPKGHKAKMMDAVLGVRICSNSRCSSLSRVVWCKVRRFRVIVVRGKHIYIYTYLCRKR